jgi:hypothetical protein
VLAFLPVALLLGGCELETRAVLDLEPDGSGSVGVELRFDEALLAALDELEIDPTAELTSVVASEPDWRLERESDGAGLVLRAVRDDVDDPAAALAELAEGLDEDDPGLLVDLDVDVDEEGRVELGGSAQVRGPAAPGAVDEDGEPVGPDGQRLQQLTATHLTAELEVSMPGRVTGHDADQADGATMRWSLPPGARIPVRAVSVPHVVPLEVLLVGGGALLLAVASGAVAFALRRR